MGDIGSPLLLKFLSTSRGFKYLKESDYVLHEMEKWFEGGLNESYVKVIEDHIERVQRTWSFLGQRDERYENSENTLINSTGGKQSNNAIAAAAAAVAGLDASTLGLIGVGKVTDSNEEIPIPRHFYGELTLTEEGCHLLRKRPF